MQITDANTHTTSFVYDNLGRVKETDFPSGHAETYIYDVIGNLTSKTDRNGNVITHVGACPERSRRNALNRLTHKGYPDSTGVDYIYDLVGKIKQVTDPTGTYAFAYDNMGRLIGTSTQYAFLPGQTYTNNYTYDAASNRTGFTAPDGSTNTYVYDTLNRLSTLTNSVTGQFGFGYDALSRRTSLTRPNSVNTSYTYDNLSRLLGVLHQNGPATIDGATYTLDNGGNRTSKVNQPNGVTEYYTYDPIYQLTQVQQVVNGNTSTSESYSYDAVGNRLSSLSVATYSYNNSNEQTSSSDGYSYTYDANGNTLTKANSAGTTTYGWDFENRLSSVTLPNGGGVVSFKYDPFGRRIQKSSPSGRSNFIYESNNLLEELNSSGAVVAKYSQGIGTDEPLAMLRSGATSFYHTDGLGSLTSLTSAAGALAQSYTYDTFGKVIASSGSLSNPFQYTGRELDPETGLLYLRARYYDPSTGRFLSEDPLRFKSGTDDFYVYGDNDPTDNTDPSGLRVQVCCRPLHSAFTGKLLGKNHCYVLITSEDDQRQFDTYGLHREDASGKLYPNGAKPVQNDPTDAGGTCSDVKDSTPCKEREFIKKAMSDTNCPSCGSNYWFSSTNSNYWVWNALTNAGMTPPVFPGGNNSPGYGPPAPPLPPPPIK